MNCPRERPRFDQFAAPPAQCQARRTNEEIQIAAQLCRETIEFIESQSGVPQAIQAHQHRRGTQMTLSKSTSTADPGTLLVDGQPWDNPPFVTYGDDNLLTFGEKEGIRWECFYDNPDPQTVYFGQSAEKNEMCFWWGYYYPSVGKVISYPDCIK